MLRHATIPMRQVLRYLLAHPTGRWVFLGSCIGFLCGLVAAVFEVATDLLSQRLLMDFAGLPALVAVNHSADVAGQLAVRPLVLLAVLGLGGLAAGLVIQRWASAARGGGTGVAVHAFHHERGIIPPATTWTKLVASIISLGSGASGGREGPISLVGAGVASWFCARLRLTARDRRILLAAGIAGGIAAVFRAPLAAAIFAAEVLYRGPELESDVLIPAFIASVVGFLTGSLGLDLLGPLSGHVAHSASTLFQPPMVAFHAGDAPQMVGYTLIALASALVARWFITLHQQTVNLFNRLPLPFWGRPALGALATGLIALGLMVGITHGLGLGEQGVLALGTVGGGYGVIHWLFAGMTGHHIAPLLLAGLLLVIALGKSLTTALSVGSGGSAGLFGPSIVIGGITGAAVGCALEGLAIGPPLAACILTGMAGVLAATHRTPVAALLMVSEIAGTWLLLLPAMWVSGLAFLLVGRRSLISGQVEGIQDSPAHRSHLFADVLARAKVRDLTEAPAWTVIPAASGIAACRALAMEAQQDQFPVVRADGHLVGILDRLEILKMTPDPLLDGLVVADDLAGGAGAALHPGDTLAQALRELNHHRVDELPVVDAQGIFTGMVSSGMLMRHYRKIVEQTDRDRADEGFQRRVTETL